MHTYFTLGDAVGTLSRFGYKFQAANGNKYGFAKGSKLAIVVALSPTKYAVKYL